MIWCICKATYIYIYIYVCVWVCVCVLLIEVPPTGSTNPSVLIPVSEKFLRSVVLDSRHLAEISVSIDRHLKRFVESLKGNVLELMSCKEVFDCLSDAMPNRFQLLARNAVKHGNYVARKSSVKNRRNLYFTGLLNICSRC